MFLDSNYVLGNELVQKMDIHIANVSMVARNLEKVGNYEDIVKLGNCTFINKKSLFLPKNIVRGIITNDFTPMYNKLPCTYVHQEFQTSQAKLLNSNFIKGIVEVSGKKFYEFEDKFIEDIHEKVLNILDREDALDCFDNGDILGYVELSKNKFLTWY